MPLTPFLFVLTTLAVWRCVVFIRQDGLVDGTRRRVTVFLGRRDGLLATKALYLIGCQWCLSIWLAGCAVVAWELTDLNFTIMEGIVTWLALAAASSLTDLLADHL